MYVVKINIPTVLGMLLSALLVIDPSASILLMSALSIYAESYVSGITPDTVRAKSQDIAKAAPLMIIIRTALVFYPLVYLVRIMYITYAS